MESKICRYCLVEQSPDNFEIANTVNGKVYRRRKCAACKRETQAKRKVRLRLWMEQYKQARCCERCGYSDHRALEFHHLRREEKAINVSEMLRGNSVATMKREIAKCVLLCANCHAIEHYHDIVVKTTK